MCEQTINFGKHMPNANVKAENCEDHLEEIRLPLCNEAFDLYLLLLGENRSFDTYTQTLIETYFIIIYANTKYVNVRL